MNDSFGSYNGLNQAVVSGKISGLIVGHVNPHNRNSPLRANFNLVCDVGAGKVVLVPCEAYGNLAKSLCLHDRKDGLVSLVAHIAPTKNIGIGRCLVAEAVSTPLVGSGHDLNQVILEGVFTEPDSRSAKRGEIFPLRIKKDDKEFLLGCNISGARSGKPGVDLDKSFLNGHFVRVVGRIVPGMVVDVDYVERVKSRNKAQKEQVVKSQSESCDIGFEY